MGSVRTLIVAFFLLQCGVGRAQETNALAVSTARQLLGVTTEKAGALVVALEDAQQRLRSGDGASFELVAGPTASHEMANVSPRDAFLRVSFEKVWRIERVPTESPHRQSYRLTYAPDGLGRLYWDIYVVLDVNGAIQLVRMLYEPPPAF